MKLEAGKHYDAISPRGEQFKAYCYGIVENQAALGLNGSWTGMDTDDKRSLLVLVDDGHQLLNIDNGEPWTLTARDEPPQSTPASAL